MAMRYLGYFSLNIGFCSTYYFMQCWVGERNFILLCVVMNNIPFFSLRTMRHSTKSLLHTFYTVSPFFTFFFFLFDPLNNNIQQTVKRNTHWMNWKKLRMWWSFTYVDSILVSQKSIFARIPLNFKQNVPPLYYHHYCHKFSNYRRGYVTCI